MATVHETSPAAGIGTGILMPKLKHNWRLRLPRVEGGEAVTRQIVGMSDVQVLPNGIVTLSIEDDELSSAMKVIYDLRTRGTTFDMVVDILDRNEKVLETRSFSPCQINMITLDKLTFTPEREKQWIHLSAPEKMGSKIDALKEKYPELEAFLFVLNGLTVTWPLESTTTGQIIHSVDVTYDTVLLSYPKL